MSLTAKFQVTWPAPSPVETLVIVGVKVPRQPAGTGRLAR